MLIWEIKDLGGGGGEAGRSWIEEVGTLGAFKL